MPFTQYSYRPDSTRRPALGIVKALVLLLCFCSTATRAEDLAALRARVIQEVLAEVPELDLAKQIVEIRLKREYLNQEKKTPQPSLAEQSPIKTPPSKRVLIRQPIQTESRPSDVDTKNWNQ